MSRNDRCNLRCSLEKDCPWWVGALVSVSLYAGMLWAPMLAMCHEESSPFDLCCYVAPQAAPLAMLLLIGLGVECTVRQVRSMFGCRTEARVEVPEKPLEASDLAEVAIIHYQRQGYVVKASYDYGMIGGMDVELRRDGERTLVQCKPWRGKLVELSVLKELHAVINSGQAVAGVVLTTSAFTPEARAFAQGKALTLIDGALLNQIVHSVRDGSDPKTL